MKNVTTAGQTPVAALGENITALFDPLEIQSALLGQVWDGGDAAEVNLQVLMELLEQRPTVQLQESRADDLVQHGSVAWMRPKRIVDTANLMSRCWQPSATSIMCDASNE